MINVLTRGNRLADDVAEKLRTRVCNLVGDLATKTWEVAAILYQLWDAWDHFSRWGFLDRNEWLDRELKLDRCKAGQLRRMFQYFAEERPLSPELEERLHKLDWTKARCLVGHVTETNANELIATAERSTREDLQTWIKQNGAKPTTDSLPQGCTGERFRIRRFSLAYTPDDNASQCSMVDEALERSKQLSRSNKDGHNLALICTDFLATNSFGKEDDPDMLARYFFKIESLLGVRLIALDTKTSDLVYGKEAIKCLVDASDQVMIPDSKKK